MIRDHKLMFYFANSSFSLSLKGEEFGKNWNMEDCVRCIPLDPELSSGGSYEDLSKDNEVNIEMNQSIPFKFDEKTPLEGKRNARRQTMRKLARQQSVMDTQKTGDLGSMQLTYWF